MRPANRQASSIAAALSALVLFTSAMQAVAHEYWLDPVGARWVVGEELQADIRNGQEFLGTTLPFDPAAFARAGLISDSHRQGLDGRLGDYPAIRLSLQDAGLNLLLLETTPRELRYDDFEDFETFLDYHGLHDIAERHQARGLPRQDIVEHYYRYCKSLIEVEPSTISSTDTPSAQASSRKASALAAQNQRLELIADSNPMQADTLRLQLRFEGKALAGRQVELFFRGSADTVMRTLAVTDDTGHVEFATESAGDYLVNSVKVVEPTDTTAHWETHWASLTFQKNGNP